MKVRKSITSKCDLILRIPSENRTLSVEFPCDVTPVRESKNLFRELACESAFFRFGLPEQQLIQVECIAGLFCTVVIVGVLKLVLVKKKHLS